MAVFTGPKLATAGPNSLTRGTTAVASVGTRAYADVNDAITGITAIQQSSKQYVYVRALVAVTTSGHAVGLITDFNNVQPGDLDSNYFVGIAEAPIASGEFGYVQDKGTCLAVVESGATAGLRLQLSATAGQLKAITTSGDAVAIALAATAGGDAAIPVYLI